MNQSAYYPAESNQRPTGTPQRKISGAEYEYIRDLVYEQSRIKLGENKRELVMARVSKRLRALRIGSFGDYIQLLRTREGEREIVDLIDAISTNHTFFFREAAHFAFLMEKALPELTAAPDFRNNREFRVWSAAASTGEEPYSIGICLSEYFEGHEGSWQLQCSDISTKVLKKAMDGVFAAERLNKMRRDWVGKYFQKGYGDYEGFYRIRDQVRSRMDFQRLNLLAPSYPFRQGFHVIFCRNVMIYFDRETQAELIARIVPLLVPGGYLFIGHAESLAGIKHELKMIQPATYRKT